MGLATKIPSLVFQFIGDLLTGTATLSSSSSMTFNDAGILLAYETKAINFNSSTSLVRYANDFVGGYGTQFAISFWIKPVYQSSVLFPIIIGSPQGGTGNVGGGAGVFIALKRNTSTEYGITFNFQDPSDSDHPNSGLNAQIDNANITVGAWNHVFYSFNNTGSLSKLSVNGSTKTLSSTFENTAFFPSGSDNDTFLGAAIGTGTSLVDNFKGDLADVWIDNGFLDATSSTEIAKFRTSLNKPTGTYPSSQVLLKGDATDWQNTGSKDLGTQTLTNISTATSNPTD